MLTGSYQGVRADCESSHGQRMLMSASLGAQDADVQRSGGQSLLNCSVRGGCQS